MESGGGPPGSWCVAEWRDHRLASGGFKRNAVVVQPRVAGAPDDGRVPRRDGERIPLDGDGAAALTLDGAPLGLCDTANLHAPVLAVGLKLDGDRLDARNGGDMLRDAGRVP